MTAHGITKLGMPKWGLSMTEGTLVSWLVEDGTELQAGDAVAEVETEKINGIVEAPSAGVLSRKVAQAGETWPVGALLGVIAEPSVSAAEIDAFVAEFQATFVPEVEEGEGEPAAETVALDGRVISYVRRGEGGEPLLLLHGFGGDLDGWLFNIDALAAGRTVIALDLPGHGGSTKDVRAGDLESYVDTVAGFLDSAGLAGAHLAGHSMGGAVAIGLALARPEAVASLTLIASAGLGPEINAEYIEGFVAARSRREMAPLLELLFADPGAVTRQLVEDVLRYKRLDGVEDALRTVASRFFPGGRQAYDLAGPLAASEVPILAVWGGDDRIIPAAHAAALPARARGVILEGRGHSPQLEAAGEVNRLIDEFLPG